MRTRRDQRRRGRPRSTVSNAVHVVRIATGEEANDHPSAAQTLGALGGLARAEVLPPTRRSEIAKTAAESRWKEPPQYMVLWSKRDKRIAWGTPTTHCIDMQEFLADLGPQLGENPVIAVEQIDTWGNRRPFFTLMFSDRELGLKFSPHGKKLSLWGNLADIAQGHHPNLGHCEINIETSMEANVRRIKKMLGQIDQTVSTVRAESAEWAASVQRFLDRIERFRDIFPELVIGDYQQKDMFNVGFALPDINSYDARRNPIIYRSRPMNDLSGRLMGGIISLQGISLNLTMDAFVEFMDFLRTRKAFEPCESTEYVAYRCLHVADER